MLAVQKLSEGVSKRLAGLLETLAQPDIDVPALRLALREGIPDEFSQIREMAWKVVLGYLPRCKAKWADAIAKQEAIYQSFVKQFLPEERFTDYPIALSKQHPRYLQLQDEFQLWEQIEKDTCRTQSELSFFSCEALPILIPFLSSARKEKHRAIRGEQWENREEQRLTYRYDYMTRILFVYARLNPRAGYVQGMNEVLAPIFYLVNGAVRRQNMDEAACFFMFNNVMADLIELNIEDFDKRENGVHARLQEIDRLLLASHPKIWHRLALFKIDPLFYSFRWLTLLFAQEFELFQTLRIWQTIFSFEDRATFVNFFAVQLLVASSSIILTAEYGQILSHLKHIREHVDLESVLPEACNLYLKYRGADLRALAQKNFQKYAPLKLGEQVQQQQRKGKGRGRYLVNFLRKLM